MPAKSYFTDRYSTAKQWRLSFNSFLVKLAKNFSAKSAFHWPPPNSFAALHIRLSIHKYACLTFVLWFTQYKIYTPWIHEPWDYTGKFIFKYWNPTNSRLSGRALTLQCFKMYLPATQLPVSDTKGATDVARTSNLQWHLFRGEIYRYDIPNDCYKGKN